MNRKVITLLHVKLSNLTHCLISLVHALEDDIVDFALEGDYMVAIQQTDGGKYALFTSKNDALPLQAATFANGKNEFDQITLLDW